VTAVVKVGGSLEADPHRRRALLTALADGVLGRCIVVPGGGTFAGAVRAAQAREGGGIVTTGRIDGLHHHAAFGLDLCGEPER
jgi:aspartokinase-like uncharacterized kinase